MPDDALPDPSATETQDAPVEERPKPVRARRAAAPAPAPVARRRPVKTDSVAAAVDPAPPAASKLEELEARLAVPPPVPAPVPPVPPAPPAPRVRRVDTVPAPPVAAPVEVGAVPEQRPRAAASRIAAALVVLLLAVAAGLGTAALALHRSPTFEATTTVRLVPVSGAGSPDAVRAAVTRYEGLLAARDLSTEAAASVGVRRSALTDPVRVRSAGADALRLVVRARSAGDAAAVAQAAGTSLVELVVVDQTDAAQTPEDALSAAVTGTSHAERVRPTNGSAALAGGLAALAVLLLAGAVAALLRARSAKKA